METMDELTWSLDKMLEEAKKKPMDIKYDFDSRFKIWAEQIIRDRRNAIIQLNGNPDYVKRMIALTIDDYDRLSERSRKEFMINKNLELYRKRNIELSNITMSTIQMYESEIKEMK